MRTARAIIVWALLPIAIAGTLAMSASATIDLFTSQGVSMAIAPAAVLMLEVTSLAGTLLWVLVQNPSLRRDARLVTLGATGVALVAGVYTYGPVGAVAGVLLVAITHLASRCWREPWATSPEPEPASSEDAAAETEPRETAGPVRPRVTTTAKAEPEKAATEPQTVGELAADKGMHTAPRNGSAHPVPEALELDLFTWIKAKALVEGGAGRPRLMRELGLKDNQARKVLAEAKAAVS